MNFNLLDDLKIKFQEAGQGHVFQYFENQVEDRQKEFLQRALSIDLANIDRKFRESKLKELEKGCFSNLKPVESSAKLFKQNNNEDEKAIIAKGEEAIRKGKVCALLVAGGDGTRLGFSGPKGALAVTPVKGKSLFQIFAEQIQVAQKRYSCIIPWFIMTSEGNYRDTVNFFLANNDFGLEEVHFFKQGSCPIIDFEGKLLLDENGLIAVAPDGHGGCFESLCENGCMRKMESLGIDIINYFQVDNPLVKCIDPFFIGLHILSDAQISCKVVKKRNPSEQVGVFCEEDGKVKVVEYTYLLKDLREERDEKGKLLFDLGNIGVHLIDVEFAKKMGECQRLEWHQIRKKVTFLDKNGHVIVPDQPNALKFEKLIFDCLAQAKKVILLEVKREEEFSPIKNAEGIDSLHSSRSDQIHRYLEWFKKVGIDLSEYRKNFPAFAIEISPFFSDSQDVFIQKWNSLMEKPTILTETYLE